MLSKEDLIDKILKGSIVAWIDEGGRYWLSGDGGQGVPHFTKLKTEHPFTAIIKGMEGIYHLEQERFFHQYYAQELLARLTFSQSL